MVTRYFGGTMLGAGGLVRAYGRAVTETITQIGIVERQPRHRLNVSIGYDDAGRIEHALRTSPHALAAVVYGDTQATFTLYLETALLPVVKAWLAELTNGSANVAEADAMWIDVPIADHAGQIEAE